MKKEYSVVIFYKGNEIIYQERYKITDLGKRRYAFWGGKLEKGETLEKTLKRELQEELRLKLIDYSFWKSFNSSLDTTEVVLHVFLSPITDEVITADIQEGKKTVRTDIDIAINSGGFHQGDLKVLSELKDYLRK